MLHYWLHSGHSGLLAVSHICESCFCNSHCMAVISSGITSGFSYPCPTLFIIPEWFSPFFHILLQRSCYQMSFPWWIYQKCNMRRLCHSLSSYPALFLWETTSWHIEKKRKSSMRAGSLCLFLCSYIFFTSEHQEQWIEKYLLNEWCWAFKPIHANYM